MQLALLCGGAAFSSRTTRRGCATQRGRARSARVCSASAGAVESTLAQRDACSRYRESARPAQERLVDDAYAVLLVRHCARAVPRSVLTTAPVQLGGDDAARSLAQSLEPTCASVVVARCLDAALLNAACADGTRQLAVVGHGADTRAFRLAWPGGVRLFELGPHDALAHAELAFHGQAIRPNKSILLRRVPADVSGTAASGNGWASRLLAAGFMPDEATAWALQGMHLLQPNAVEALLVELGSVAAIGSVVTGESALPEVQLRTLLAQCGFQLDACERLTDVAAGLGRELLATGTADARMLFSARKTRLTGVQQERLQEELQRAEYESGEEGFGDSP